MVEWIVDIWKALAFPWKSCPKCACRGYEAYEVNCRCAWVRENAPSWYTEADHG